jgi:hypothetical protein
MPRLLTQAIIEEWIALVPVGKFNVRDIWAEVGIESAEGKTSLRKILERLEAKGIIVSLGGGAYRKIDSNAAEIDWQSADPQRVLPLRLPFAEHDIAKIYPKSIIIVAGGKNAGKTAYLYNFVHLNMNQFQVDLYNSETSPEQMHERFSPLNIPVPAPFHTFERYDNFGDIIHPDHVSVIDYLDLNSEVYLVGAEIDAIFRKLRKGVAVIGLQKPPPTSLLMKDGTKKLIDRDLAYGGAFTAKRAVLYISMNGGKPGKLKLVYVKTPKNPKIKPDNMTFEYEIAEDGVHFEGIQRYYGDD